MIRSAKEAREFCEKVKIEHRCFSEPYSLKYEFCRGYLACLEGPEVTALVKAIDSEYNDRTKVIWWKNVAKAIREYHEAVKP